jgi:hypothetical protein
MKQPQAVKKLLRESERDFTQLRRQMRKAKGQQLKLLVTEAPAAEFLLRETRFMRAAVEMIAAAFYSFSDPAAEERTCFGCLKPWSPERAIATIVAIEFLGRSPVPGMLAGLCDECAGKQDLMLEACRRDFGDLRVEHVHAAGQA